MQLKHLTKTYAGRAAVSDVSLDLPKSAVISFIGPNGAGKSTLLGMLARLLPRDGGEILLDGKDIRDFGRQELSRKLAILTQANHIQMKLTVRELVSFGRFPYSGSRLTRTDEERVADAIDYMELGDFADCFLDELSGGQRQRACIAMVIAQDTDYVLLDEPTNNLDIYHATNLMKLVRRLADERGKTVLLVLHEINYAAFYSDRICAMAGGKVFRYGTVDEVMTPDTLAALYRVNFELMRIQGRPLAIYY